MIQQAYTKANQLADELMLLSYREIVFGLLFSLAFIGGFVGYLFATDTWNIGQCLLVY